MFYLTVKATGGKIKDEHKVQRGNAKPPEASFDQLASFIGAM